MNKEENVMKIILSLLMAVMFLGGQAAADEPDICEGQVGAAFGLCQAYINMGCDTADPDASEVACAKVEAAFIKITGSTPPWANQCPLWSKEELDILYGDCYEWAYNDDCYNEGLTSICKNEARGPDPDRYTSITMVHNPVIDLQIIFIRAFDPESGIQIDRAIEASEEGYDACSADLFSHEFTVCQ
jgi:hypothetical protein